MEDKMAQNSTTLSSMRRGPRLLRPDALGRERSLEAAIAAGLNSTGTKLSPARKRLRAAVPKRKSTMLGL